MKFSSTDKRSETVSLIRNKKIYFMGRSKCIIKKIECWPVFKQDPWNLCYYHIQPNSVGSLGCLILAVPPVAL